MMRTAVAGIVAVIAILSAGPAGAEQAPPGDPPGNNGTIKVAESDPPEPDPNNEPHVDGCTIWLEFFGFDQGQTANITFIAQAPSGNGEELLRDENVTISDDAAGGGQDNDAVLSYILSPYLSGLERHPQQGFHIKVRSDTLQAPGGYKAKVFWINCNPAPATALGITKTVEGPGGGPFGFSLRCNHRPLDRRFSLNAGESHEVTGSPDGTTCIVTETDEKGAAETRISESSPDKAADGQVKTSASRSAVTFTNVFGGPKAAQVAGAQETAPPLFTIDRLPRTGGDGQAVLTTLGLWALAAGSLAVAFGRPRRER